MSRSVAKPLIASGLCLSLALACGGGEEPQTGTPQPTSRATPIESPLSAELAERQSQYEPTLYAGLPDGFPAALVYEGATLLGNQEYDTNEGSMTVFHTRDDIDVAVPAIRDMLDDEGWLVEVSSAEAEVGTVVASRGPEQALYTLLPVDDGTEISVMLFQLE